MSRFIAGQWDEYGTTFWIPSQVEPTVALIGTSIPTLRQLFTGVLQDISTRRSKNTKLSDASVRVERSFNLENGRQNSSHSLTGSRGELIDHGVSLDTIGFNGSKNHMRTVQAENTP
jgi:hypothetical protein